VDRLDYSAIWRETAWNGLARRPAVTAVEERRPSRLPPTESEGRSTATAEPLTATVISAAPLTHGEVGDLIDRLRQRYKRPIHAEVRVKAGFPGGARVEIGDDVWTTSLRSASDEMERSRDRTDQASLNSLLFGHEESRSEAHAAPREREVAAERSMPLGKAIVAPPAAALERYEYLQSNMWARYPATSMRLLLLAGAERRSGVSTAATNLAVSLASNTCARVLLIDAGVRIPKGRIPVPKEAGSGNADVSLRRLLIEQPALREPVPGPSNLYVLPSGARCGLALSVFQSRGFDELLRAAREMFEYVVIDAPSLPEHPETLLLSRKADGVILVVESERTRRQSALWAKQQIEMTGATLLGVILNRRKYRVPSWLYKRI
jgi:Mrp family chromosome partitioning ATPase